MDRCANIHGCGNPGDPRTYSRCDDCAQHYIRVGHDRTPIADHQLPSTVDVCRITGLTFRQVDYIDRSNRVKPTVGARGSGTQRAWTIDDVVAVVVANIAMQHRLDVDARNPPPFVMLRPGVVVRFDLATIRDEVAERWPDGRAYDLPGRAPEQVAS